MIASIANSTRDKECDELLRSLDSIETSDRFRQVERAHSQTFEWLFAKSELGFKSWLETGNGLYWCRGHPATGKSTLMKWLYNDPRTVEALALGVGRKVRANFFFHDRGAEIQKSFKGLLQGIVYQILQETPELLPLLLPIRERIVKRLDASWNEEDIHKAFQIVLTQQTLPLDITLFLDALDEYDGSHKTITNFLYSITNPTDTTETKLKVCFSSRPLQIFLDSFTDILGFSIHEHTGPDIELVIQSRMSENPRMSKYVRSTSLENQRLAKHFATEIFSKAEGIFLWVKLVLDELLDEFTAGETLQELIKKLVFLPRKLEDYYQHTLDRLPCQYRTDTKVIFEIIRCAIRPLRLHDFFEICRCTKMETLANCPSCTAMDSGWNYDSIERWIRSRTGGLVQIVLEEYGDGIPPPNLDFFCAAPYVGGETTYIVQFLHQTVKTFSQISPWPTHSIDDRYPCHNGHAYIAKYILALVFQHLPDGSHADIGFFEDGDTYGHKDSFWGRSRAFHLILSLYDYMSRAESKSPRILLPSLIECGDDRISNLFRDHGWIDDRSSNLFRDHGWIDQMQQTHLNSVFAFAVAFDLCDLLEGLCEEIGGQHNVSSPPLLHLAFPKRHMWTLDVDFTKRARTIRILLKHGADAKEIYDGYTPYELLCKLAMEGELWLGGSSQNDLLTMIVPFLQAGQSPSAQIPFYRGRRMGRRLLKQTLLHYAAENADRELIFALLEYGANVNALDDSGLTPLDFICAEMSDLIDEYLAEAFGSRPRASLSKRIQAASLLISRGGRFGIPIKGADNGRAISQAQVEALRARGVDVNDGVVRSPQTQIRGRVFGFLAQPLNKLKGYGAS